MNAFMIQYVFAKLYTYVMSLEKSYSRKPENSGRKPVATMYRAAVLGS